MLAAVAKAKPKDLSGTHRPAGPPERSRTKPYVCPVGAAHIEFIAALAGHPPRPIPLEAGHEQQHGCVPRPAPARTEVIISAAAVSENGHPTLLHFRE